MALGPWASLLACFQLAATLTTHSLDNRPGAPQAAALEEEASRQRQLVREKQRQFTKLQANIREVCARDPDVVPGNGADSEVEGVVIEPKFRVGYCVHNKAGSSTVMKHLYQLHNKSLVRLWALKSELSPARVGVKDIASLNRYRKSHGAFLFSFVRHPFKRLVSAFINKIGGRMDPKFNGLANRLNGSFSKFVDYVLQDFQNGVVDPHWVPFHARCHPCLVDYDFIGRQEDFVKDMQYVVVASNLTGEGLDVRNLRAVSSQGYEQSHRGDRTAKYFAMISPQKKQMLYKLYKKDFELFNYSAEPYL